MTPCLKSGLVLCALLATGCAARVPREDFVPSVSKLAASGDLKETVDELARPLLTSGRNIGMVVGFATADEEGIYAYGSKDLAGNDPMTTDALFQTGSISKSFVALLAAELERQQRLKLDDPVGPYLPKNLHLASPELGQVTFAELASHTSGMKHECYTLELLWGVMTYLVNGKSLYRYLDDQVMVDYLTELDFQHPKERRYAYSNIGFTYLGWILNQFEPGKSFAALMQEQVFSPLQLKHTGIGLVGTSPALTPGYAGDLPTFVSRNTSVEPWLFEESIAAAGGVYSNAADLLTYAKINAGLKPSPLKPSLDRTRQPQVDAEGGKMGLSWFMKTLPDSGEPYTYIAGIVGGHTSFVGFDEKRKLAVVVLQNSINHDDMVGVELLDRMVGAYRLKHDGIKPTPRPTPQYQTTPVVARAFEGRAMDYSSK